MDDQRQRDAERWRSDAVASRQKEQHRRQQTRARRLLLLDNMSRVDADVQARARISALAAATILGEELRTLCPDRRPIANGLDRIGTESTSLASVWETQRLALVPVMDPADLQALWKALPLPAGSAQHDLGDLVCWVDGITRVLWVDLQSIVFTSFVRRRLSGGGSLVDQISRQQDPSTRVKPSTRATT